MKRVRAASIQHQPDLPALFGHEEEPNEAVHPPPVAQEAFFPKSGEESIPGPRASRENHIPVRSDGASLGSHRVSGFPRQTKLARLDEPVANFGWSDAPDLLRLHLPRLSQQLEF